MSDYLVRGVLKQKQCRFTLGEMRDVIERAVQLHDCDPLSGAIMADGLISAVLLAPILDDDEKFSIRVDYPGLVKTVLLEVNSNSQVRCCMSDVHLMASAPEEIPDETTLFGEGDGMISVVRSQDGKILNSGQTKAPLAQVSADIGFYFSLSDQLETEIGTFYRFNTNVQEVIHSAAGVMIQAMPGCDLNEFETLRKNIHSERIGEIMRDRELGLETKINRVLAVVLGISLDELIKDDNISYEFAAVPVFRCSCSRERMLQAMQVLKPDEIKDIFEQQSSVKVKCQFCRTEYEFEKADLLKD